MFVFLGSYSGGGGGSSRDDNDSHDEGSTDDHTQTVVGDFNGGGDGGNDSGQDSASGSGPPASPGGGGGGGGVVTQPTEGKDPGDGDDAEEGEECEDKEEREPESSGVEEPESEPEDDAEENTEEEETGNDDEDDETVVLLQEVDPLSAMSWGVQPVMKHIEECYGEEVDLFYKPAPVREIDSEQEKRKWIEAGQQVGMPIDPSFWDEEPPGSTELVNKAFEAAIQQYRGDDYIRALWRRGVVAGHDINDKEVLIDMASELGMDKECFEEDLEEAELASGKRDELPFTFMEIQGKPVPKNGRVRYSDFKTQFTFQGLEEHQPQELQSFVDDHGPVAAPEVMEVYEIRRKEAIQRLEDLDGVSSFEVGGEDFWY